MSGADALPDPADVGHSRQDLSPGGDAARTGPGRHVPDDHQFGPTYQCIAVATATSPEGPFPIVGERDAVCPAEEGGAIDASTFTDDDGTRYLLWKNDGNCCGFDTSLYIAP